MIHLINGPGYDKIKILNSLEVCGITFTDVKQNWIHRERFLSADQMIFLRKGELYLEVNGKKYTVRKNSFFYIRKFSTLSGYKTSDMPCEFHTISFNATQVSVPDLREIMLNGNNIFIEELAKRLYDARSAIGSDENECEVLFLALLHEVERFHAASPGTFPLMEQTMNYINNNINNPITVDSICDHLGYNRDYISKQFLRYYGISIKKYIDQKKITAAKHLLISSKMSLEQIASAIGFENAQQFYKFFNYHEKISPTQFRNHNT